LIEFRAPDLIAPDGSIVGVIEEGASTIQTGSDALPSEPGDYILSHPFSKSDPVARARGISRLLELRRAGAAFLILTYDEALLEGCADEIWWLRDGRLMARGDPAEILPVYRRHVARLLRAAGEGGVARLAPAMRDGDGRAVLESVELIGENGQPATVWRSGEAVSIRVSVRYVRRVEDPVIGILIRTRVGLNVYGTNTELEQLHLGPVEPGQTLRVTCRFRCELCPGDYTVTAASHDPDGVWHDWQEDAVAFAVADSRYTAGVANLRGQMVAELIPTNPIPTR
jgi:lipopolysaccharide transport system ATP-binding protein